MGPLRARNRSIVISLLALVAGMALLAYASVPLYRLFCQATGFGGTPRRAALSTHAIDRTITVQFNADIDPDLPWRFYPKQKQAQVKLGENKLVFFTAENVSDKEITGNAVYNVTPFAIGSYFNKVQCFCFQEQTLKPRQKVDMPVSFYVDPAMLGDAETKDIATITLSYTFFRVKNRN